MDDLDKIIDDLERIVGELPTAGDGFGPEDITREDLERHPSLRRFVVLCDRVAGGARRDAIEWAKRQGR